MEIKLKENHLYVYQQFALYGYLVSIILGGNALINLCLAITILVFLLDRNIYKKRVINDIPMPVYLIMGLGFWLLLSIFWTESHGEQLIEGIRKTRIYFLFFIMWIIFYNRPAKAIEKIITVLYVALIINMAITYAASFGIITLEQGLSLKNRIVFGHESAILLILCIFYYLERSVGNTYFHIAITILCVYAAYFIEDGRGGYVLTSAVLISWIMLKNTFSPNKRTISVIIFTSALLILLSSGHISKRINYTINEVNNIDLNANHSSLEVRINKISAGLEAIEDNYVIGSGLGSYKSVTQEYEVNNYKIGVGNNPLNQYILIFVEGGVIAFILLILFLYSIANREKNYRSNLMTTLSIVIILASAFNSILYDMSDRYLFATLVALFLRLTSIKNTDFAK